MYLGFFFIKTMRLAKFMSSSIVLSLNLYRRFNRNLYFYRRKYYINYHLSRNLELFDLEIEITKVYILLFLFLLSWNIFYVVLQHIMEFYFVLYWNMDLNKIDIIEGKKKWSIERKSPEHLYDGSRRENYVLKISSFILSRIIYILATFFSMLLRILWESIRETMFCVTCLWLFKV